MAVISLKQLHHERDEMANTLETKAQDVLLMAKALRELPLPTSLWPSRIGWSGLGLALLYIILLHSWAARDAQQVTELRQEIAMVTQTVSRLDAKVSLTPTARRWWTR